MEKDNKDALSFFYSPSLYNSRAISIIAYKMRRADAEDLIE